MSSDEQWPIERVLVDVAKRPGALAVLRGGAGRPLADDVASWPYVMRVTRNWDGQEAAHIALVLFAVHQQSQSLPMHCAGWDLGRSCHRLAFVRKQNGGSEEGVKTRLLTVLAAETPDE
ncbi:MAG: type I-E CRISPR-associated protein Cse2/CasB, partial [Acidimicrobiales bacterium]